jgi:low affinity Fe/Cu permease
VTNRTSQDSIRPPGSRALHVIDRTVSRPAIAWLLVAADTLWVAYSVSVGFPARLETIFQTLVAALTLAIVFVIQHTQSRDQVVVQRKLDELLAALPQADSALISMEDASDSDLKAIHRQHLDIRDGRG